jgi:hypothetical protein
MLKVGSSELCNTRRHCLLDVNAAVPIERVGSRTKGSTTHTDEGMQCKWDLQLKAVKCQRKPLALVS